jgi:hypothetical protein
MQAAQGGGGSGRAERAPDADELKSVSKRIVGSVDNVGLQKKRILREDDIFDPEDPNIKEVRLYRRSNCPIFPQ